MGYLNLTTIIDRIICDPTYGASNYGDIKDLTVKMLEMCTYEQILLSKTANLVSNDVHTKLVTFKKFSSKSFSSQANYCQYCSQPFEPNNTKNLSIKTNASMVETPLPLDSTLPNKSDVSFEVKTDPGDISVCIFHCGHSFHENCLEISDNQLKNSCPLFIYNFN